MATGLCNDHARAGAGPRGNWEMSLPVTAFCGHCGRLLLEGDRLARWARFDDGPKKYSIRFDFCNEDHWRHFRADRLVRVSANPR